MNGHVISTIVLAAHWIIIAVLSVRVIMRRIPIGFSMAWLAVIFSIPFIGAVLYLFFGEKRLGRRRTARIARVLHDVTEWQKDLRGQEELLPVASKSGLLDRHAERILGYPALAGNELDLFEDFETTFDSIVADIDQARRSCHLGFYIWNEGGRADDVMDALVRASGRGVACHILADAVGSKAFLRGGQVGRLRDAGVTVVTALPTGLLRSLFTRADLRNHRKIIVIDDEIAYTGSQNLVDPRYFKQDAGVGQWVDAMARMRGPAVGSLAGVFLLDWCFETGGDFKPPGFSPPGSAEGGGLVVQVVPSGPGLRPEAIHQLLLAAIYAARDELILTTPYFVPDESVVTALLSAALSDVDVTLIVPAENDSLLVRYASMAAFDDLLAAGARIALFKEGLLHTKSITIDREVGIFGSVNLDMRSLWLNFEISLFVYDSGFATRLRELQYGYLERSDLLDPDLWRRRPLRHRLAENTIRLLSPLL